MEERGASATSPIAACVDGQSGDGSSSAIRAGERVAGDGVAGDAGAAGTGRGSGASGALAVAPCRRRTNFVARHWRGEFSLPISYWVFGVGANLVASFALTLLLRRFEALEYDPLIILSSMVAVWVGTALISAWQIVGVWRSADSYITARRSGGARAPWAYAAKLMMVLSILRFGVDIYESAIPQILETSRIYFLGDPDIPDYALRVMRNGAEVELSGGFKFGLDRDLIKVLNAAPRIRVIHLDSVGGRVGEAELVYRTIREYRLITYVSHECSSACTLAFAAGRQRWVGADGTLGFHAAAFPGLTKKALAAMPDAQRRIFLAAGFDAAFVDRTLSTPSTELWSPSIDVLRRARVVTDVSDGEDFAMSGFGGGVTREGLAFQFAADLPLFRALETGSPPDFNAIADELFNGYLEGQTEGRLLAAMGAHLDATVQFLIPRADDAVLVDLAKLRLEKMLVIKRQDAGICYQYFMGSPPAGYEQYLSQELRDRDVELKLRAVQTAVQRPEPSRDKVEALHQAIADQLIERIGGDATLLLFSGKAQPAQYPALCDSAIAFYREIASLNEADAAILMRFLFKGD